MALIICRECGKKYSDYAEQCPVCGCPTSIQQKISNNVNQQISTDTDVINPEDVCDSLDEENEVDLLDAKQETGSDQDTESHDKSISSELECFNQELSAPENRDFKEISKNSLSNNTSKVKTVEEQEKELIRFLAFIFLIPAGLLMIFMMIPSQSNFSSSNPNGSASSSGSKSKASFDPAVSMQNKVIYYPDSRFPYLNTKDYKLVTGDLARIQYRMIRNRHNAKNFPSVLIGNGRWKNSKCNTSLPTLGLYMYSPACNNLITVNYFNGSIVYEHQIEVITTIAHEWGHHIINMSRRPVSGSQNEILSDCFAGVYLAYLDKYNLVTEKEAIDSIEMMGQIGITHGTGIHGTPQQRINAITSAAMFMSDPSNADNQFRWNSFCKGLEGIIDISKGLP